METVGFRCPVGFKNYPPDMTVGTGTITSKGGRGVVPPSTVLENTSMEESDTKRQELGGQSFNYSAVGKMLLRERFENNSSDIGTALAEIGKVAGEGGLGEMELEELYRVQYELRATIEIVEDVGGLDRAKKVRQSHGRGVSTE